MGITRDIHHDDVRLLLERRVCDAQQAALWIASPSLSSGAHSRDPLARNDENAISHAAN
jgi:hypothetical protein